MIFHSDTSNEMYIHHNIHIGLQTYGPLSAASSGGGVTRETNATQ